MEIEVVTEIDDFLKLENIWNSVLEKSQSDYVCLTFEWIKSWWFGFGQDKQLFILLLKDKDNLIGIVPLMLGRTRYRGLSVQEISFIQNEHSPRFDFLLTEKREEALDAVIKYFKNGKNNWNLINLTNMPKESPNYEILQHCLKRNGMLFGIKKGLQSPFIEINSDWQTYLSNRSQKFRKVLRNKINRMQRLGPYSIKKIEDVADNKEVLTKISEISKNSWKSKYNREITSSEENKRFFEELSHISSQKGWLDIWLLNSNGKSLAYEYHLKYKNRIYALRADFDQAYKDNSPGSVLDMHIVENAFKGNFKEYDMCGSQDFYKRNWTSDIREHDRFIVYRDNFYGHFIYFLEFRIISFLRKFKFIYKEAGFKGVMKRSLKKIFNLIFETNSAFWFERDLALDLPGITTHLPLEINLFARDETITWLKQNGKPWMYDQNELDIGLIEEHYFPNIKYQGKIIAYAKVGFNRVYIQDYKKTLNFPDKVAFIYDTYILPEYRRLKIVTFLVNELMRFLKDKSFKKIGCHIPLWNIASINTYSKLGFKKKKHIRYFKIFGLKFFTFNPEKLI